MIYVTDSSVALKWVLHESDSQRAIRLRDDYIAGVHDLHAPDIFVSEVGNALVSAERQKRIGSGEAVVLLNDVLQAAPQLHPVGDVLVRAMEIALTHRRAVYDCIYLALAESLGCKVVTADDQFARGLLVAFPDIVLLVALP